MIKKAIIFVLMLLPVVASAQISGGSWKIHPYSAITQAKELIDTDEKVYFLLSKNVFSFDKDTEEIESIDKSNYLSDVLVSNIYYNSNKNYLVVVYNNSNIDVILSSGKVINMPEIKDAIITSGKAINDVNFTDDGTMLVATEFGYVVIDDENFVIKESHIYYKNIASIAQVGITLVAIIDNTIYCSQVSEPHDAVSSFKSTSKKVTNGRIYPVNSSTVMVNAASNLYVGALGGSAAKPTITLRSVVASRADNVQATPTGFIANFMSEGFYYTFDNNGNNEQRIDGGNEMYSCYAHGNGTMWALGPNGLHMGGDESDFFLPNGMTLKELAFWMIYNEPLDKLYVHTTADNAVLTSSKSCRLMEVSVYDGERWYDETPDRLGTDRIDYSAYPICVSPKDPHTYVFSIRGIMSSEASRVYKVTDGKTVDIYTKSNAPGGLFRGATAFDSEGNLWIVYGHGKPSGGSNVIALPSAKFHSTATATKADWKKINVPNIETGQFKRASFCINKNDVKIYSDGGNNSPIFFWKDGINNTDPVTRTYVDFTDQDGKKVSWTYLKCITVDKNGLLWFPTSSGIVYMNPDDALTDNCVVNHIKVPRNDGTDLADYLLEGIGINCIAVDGQNRKWIATTTAGVYQVSEDGTQILHQFNTSNSMLPSNNVYTVACNTKNNSVFILTDSGLVEYAQGSGSTSNDLSNVYCYPNPVRPDFTGLLTIAGLTENALVKIADSSGNVIKQLKSSGGVATWDCCDSDGDRVATGVYYVIASTSGDGSSSNIVSKFLVVK
ncbi:MAG: hypothetical protein J5565_02180 [Muribaculaceae bacterium]|nr:hypothetical protein [Muribaculaceae bacterium]